MNTKKIVIICVCLAISICIILGVEYTVDQNNSQLETSQKTPILMYHNLTENIAECNDQTISIEKFKQDMETLKKEGYNSVSFNQLYNFVVNGKKLPLNPIVITFDDGYLSNYTYAYPILKELQMQACIFAIVNTVGVDNINGKQINPHFTYQQAKQMYDSNVIDIQSHTYNLHDISIRPGILKLENENITSYVELVTNDLLKSKNEIEQNIGNKVFVFSYPYGLHDNLTDNILKNNGISISVTTNEGVSTIVKNDLDSLYNLDRINIPSSLSTNELIKKIEEYCTNK